MRKSFYLISFLLLMLFFQSFFSLSHAIDNDGAKIKQFNSSSTVGFVENKGQFRDQSGNERSDLLYMYTGNGLKLQLLENSISFELYSIHPMPETTDESSGERVSSNRDPEDMPLTPLRVTSSRIDVQFIGANDKPEVIAEEMASDYLNYYLAYTPSDGVKEARHYNRITYKNLYPHIDLVLIAGSKNYFSNVLVYDFIIHPGGNPSNIRYRYLGIDGQETYENGTLVTVNAAGRLFEMIPESYIQNREGKQLMPVNVKFKKDKSIISFEVSNYDKKQILVIDPLLVWATYCGGIESEEGRGLAVDSEDNVISVGRTLSATNIATVGAYQTELLGPVDVMIEKYDEDGNRVWGTYYGGSGEDRARGCIVNEQEGIYLGGHTTSPDGVATPGAYRETFMGVEDAVLAYFNKDGFREWATYYGGADEDIIRRLAFDTAGNVIMIGYTQSDTGIATPGAYQTQWNGFSDVCLSKWTPDGQLIWGTYLGGGNTDHGRSVYCDKKNNIYINGSTGSEHGITKNAIRKDLAGGQDFLVGKYRGDGYLLWCSYWGGAVEDRGRGVYADPEGNYVYFTGYSASDTGVATPGSFQDTWSEGYDGSGEPFHDMVLMKWKYDGNIVWSTYMGGPPDDRGRAITMIDHDVYVAGTTSTIGLMGTPDGFQPDFGGNEDMFIEKFDSTGARIWGSYFGAEGAESTLALAVDNEKVNIFMVGTTSSFEGIATPGAAQDTFGGFDDLLLLKVELDPIGTSAETEEKIDQLIVYPNPAIGEFRIFYPFAQNTVFSIYNLNGDLLYSRMITAGEKSLVINDFSALPGIYNCILTVGEMQVTSRKLVFMRNE